MIGILSDSHDNLPAVRQAVRFFNDMNCSLVVHAGDFVAPFAAAEFRGLRCPFKAVFGNCDGEKKGLAATLDGTGEIMEAPFDLEHAGRKIRLYHLDAPVRGALRAGGFDVLVYGHTHKVDIRKEGGILVVNPGETGGWVHGRSTVVLLDPITLDVQVAPL